MEEQSDNEQDRGDIESEEQTRTHFGGGDAIEGEKDKNFEEVKQKSQAIIQDALSHLVGKRAGGRWNPEEAEAVLEVVLIAAPWTWSKGETIKKWEDLIDRMPFKNFELYQGMLSSR